MYETVYEAYLGKTNWLVEQMPFCGQKPQQLQVYLGASLDTVKEKGKWHKYSSRHILVLLVTKPLKEKKIG